jgi:ketosteroid isomerase-like protein
VLQIAVVGLVLGLAGCQYGGSTALSDADLAAIREASAHWEEHAAAGEWTEVAALYADDGKLLPPNEGPVRGRAAIHNWWQGFPETSDMKLEIVEIGGGGDVAYVHGKYSAILVPEGADAGKYIEIWRRQTDGSWKVAIDIFNSDLPVAAMSAEP